jgi:hypothetical protein
MDLVGTLGRLRHSGARDQGERTVAAEYPHLLSGDGRDDRPSSYIDVVFALVVLLAAGFSGYTSYVGFAFDFPVIMAVVACALVALGMSAINFMLRDRLRAREPWATLAFPFVFLLVISFVSNTNALYTFFVQRDIVAETQEQAWRVFDAGVATLKRGLDQDARLSAHEDRINEIERLRGLLRTQITDRRNPGLGRIARGHLEDIEDRLGNSLTQLRPPPPGAPIAEFESYAEELDDLIAAQVTVWTERSPAWPLVRFDDRVAELADLYQDAMTKREYSAETTDLMARDLEELKVDAARLGLEGADSIGEINTTADSVGSFRYTWRNFVNGINPVAITLSVLFSAMLDLLAPVLSLALFRPDDQNF